MQELASYFNIGRHHIVDVRSLGHMLLVTALCIRYLFSDWKKVVILISAFTVGNIAGMILSIFNIFRLSNHWVEFLIPLTIIITAITNVFVKKFVYKQKYPPIYFLALFFGFIHGLSLHHFSFVQLTGFTIGIEAGQFLIVLAILLLTFICISILKINRREYILFLSGGVLAVAMQMAMQRIPF